jgi:hypothetical protein
VVILHASHRSVRRPTIGFHAQKRLETKPSILADSTFAKAISRFHLRLAAILADAPPVAKFDETGVSGNQA